MKASPDEAAPEVTTEHYTSRAYNSKERICSFWHQVDEVHEMGAADVLEIGPGSGMVTDWLRQAGVIVKTMDLDARLKPDVVGSVTDIPLRDNSIDAVLCCQVLEHLPFDQAEAALAEIGRVAHLGAVISLPDVTPWMGTAYPLYFGLYADKVREELPNGWAAGARAVLDGELRARDYLFGRLVPSKWAANRETLELDPPPVPHGPLTPDDFEGGNAHCYEIGMVGYPLERITEAFERADLEIVKEFRVPENPWHHFFVAKPPESQRIFRPGVSRIQAFGVWLGPHLPDRLRISERKRRANSA